MCGPPGPLLYFTHCSQKVREEGPQILTNWTFARHQQLLVSAKETAPRSRPLNQNPPSSPYEYAHVRMCSREWNSRWMPLFTFFALLWKMHDTDEWIRGHFCCCCGWMKITLDKMLEEEMVGGLWDRLFDKHDSRVVGEPTRMLTFDKRQPHAGYLMQLSRIGRRDDTGEG